MSIPALKSPFRSPLPAAALMDPASPPFSSLALRANLAGIDGNTTPCSSLALPFKGSIACGSLTSRGRWKSSLRHKRADSCVQASAEADNMAGSRDPEEGAVQATVEQGKRILALQKELLDQIAERKKLVTALKENLGSPVEQMKAYNDGDDKMRKGAADQANDSLGQSLINQRISSKPLSSSATRAAEFRAPPGGFLQADTGKAQRSQNYETTGLPAYSRTRSSDFLPSTPTIPTTPTTPKTSTNPTPITPIPTSPSPFSPLPETPSLEDIMKSSMDKKALQQESLSEDLSKKGEVDATSGTSAEKPPPPAGPNVMNVIIVAAECAPWSKTGGLGDVAGALPKALARRGHRVMVVAPRYGVYEEAREIGVRKRYNVAGQDLEVGYYHGYIDGVDHVFIDNSVFHGFANNIYGGNREDVLKRMVLFCKAAVEVPWHVPCGGICYGDGNLVFIANDWHTALLPVYLQAYYRDHGLMQYTRSVIVIHNMAHQGRGPLSDYSLLGLPDHYIEKFRLYDPIGGEHMNIFMAGLITAHRIVAVSRGYAWECQTQEGGWGLDGVIREHNWKLRGIVNGIDDKEWNPELDVHLKGDGYVNYSLNSLESGKPICKSALQKELGLPVHSDVPMVGFIGRLDHQKGVDIIADAMPWMMEQDLQLVMLGTGRDDLENMLRSFEGRHRDKVRGWVGFSVRTAHRITAGCDILLMPSRFEPCGLNQLYAMRYGTIPVVHAVGGLRDTVQAFDPYSNTGTGWTFDRADSSAMIHALGNALWTYREFKDSWRGIQQRGMSQDLSWDNAAVNYEEVMIAAKYQW